MQWIVNPYCYLLHVRCNVVNLGTHFICHYFTRGGSCVCSQNYTILYTHTHSLFSCLNLYQAQMFACLFTLCSSYLINHSSYGGTCFHGFWCLDFPLFWTILQHNISEWRRRFVYHIQIHAGHVRTYLYKVSQNLYIKITVKKHSRKQNKQERPNYVWPYFHFCSNTAHKLLRRCKVWFLHFTHSIIIT